MVEREDYYEVAERISDYCLETFGDNTLSIILYGSVATKDFISNPTWTDIDFIVVLKAINEEQRERDEKKLDDISLKIGHQFPWFKGSSGYALIGPSLETAESLRRKQTDFGYPAIWLNGVLNAYNVLYGDDVLKLFCQVPIDKIDALYTFMTTRRHQLMWQTVWKKDKKNGITINEAIPIIKDAIFAAKNFLHYHGINLYRKPEIIKTFLKEFPKHDPKNLLNSILKAQEEGLDPKRKTDSKTLVILAQKSDRFVSKLATDLNLPRVATSPNLYLYLDKLINQATRYLYKSVIEYVILMNEGNLSEAAQYDQLMKWLEKKNDQLQ